MCNMRLGLCVCETPAEMSEENSDERESDLYDLYEVDEEEESEEEEGAATGKEEGRDTRSGEERTGEWRAIENVSSQEEEAPRRRRTEREKKKKERRAEPGKEVLECEDGEGETAKCDGESQEVDSAKRQGEKIQAEGGGGKREVPESLVINEDEDMDTSDGKRVQKKRKKKEMEKHTAESKSLDLSK